MLLRIVEALGDDEMTRRLPHAIGNAYEAAVAADRARARARARRRWLLSGTNSPARQRCALAFLLLESFEGSLATRLKNA